MLSSSVHIPSGVGWIIVSLLAVLATGCGADDFGLANASSDVRYEEARRLLAQHQVDGARDEYRDILMSSSENGAADGRAAAGLAVTETLLIFQRDPVDDLLTDHLGAEAPLDVNRAIYADNGYLYWWSRGTPWVGAGDRPGIRTLIESRLPWSAERLGSLANFTKGLTEPAGRMGEDLDRLAGSLTDIETYIQTALDDPDFQGIFIPGEVFHNDDFSVTLRRSELAALGATIAGIRAACHAFRSYEHAWSLEDAFGPQMEQMASDNPPEREGWQAWDYSVEFLSTRLASVPTGAEPREDTRAALDDALRWAEQAVDLGLDEVDRPSRLNWASVDPSYARDLRDLLVAVRMSLAEPAVLPTSDPETTANYAPLFGEGRSLPEGERWWNPNPVRADSSDPESEVLYIEWLWNEPALQQTLISGFFEPGIDITRENVTLADRIQGLEGFSSFWDTLVANDSTDTP